jgi:hypothetical protein
VRSIGKRGTGENQQEDTGREFMRSRGKRGNRQGADIKN